MVLVFLGLLGETGFLCDSWYNGINWLATGCMLQTYWMGRGWDRGGMEGPALAGAGTGEPPLAIEERRAAGSGGWHKLRRCFKGAD